MNITPELAGPGWGHMHSSGWMWAWGPLAMLFCVALLVAVVWFTVRAADTTRRR